MEQEVHQGTGARFRAQPAEVGTFGRTCHMPLTWVQKTSTYFFMPSTYSIQSKGGPLQSLDVQLVDLHANRVGHTHLLPHPVGSCCGVAILITLSL